MSNFSDSFIGFLSDSFPYLASTFSGALVKIFIAIILFVIFWVVGLIFARVVESVVGMLRVDELLARAKVDAVLQKGEIKLNSGVFLGALVKWFFIISGLLAAANVLELNQVGAFFNSVLLYIPNIIVASVILILGVLVGDFAARVVGSSVSAAGLHSAAFVSKVVKWAVFIFAFIAALDQLQIAQTFINTLYIGIIAMIALAGGLAFGLGGKEHASELIEKIKRDISSKQ